jgi:hypothetical protein
MSDILDEELNATFVRPGRDFKGQPIAEYTEGSRLLMIQCKEQQDSSIYFIWAFLYLHILLAKNKKEAIKLAWDKDLFRERLLEWVADKTQEDRELATNIVSSVIDEASKARVSIISSGGEGITLGNE